MSIASEITRLQGAKDDLKTAIEAKGVTVGTIKLDAYAAKVDLIGGGTDPIIRYYTSGATWTKPAGLSHLLVICIGGGGGASRNGYASGAGGNGGAGLCIVMEFYGA